MIIFIIHGVGGYPEENWFPWLKKELEKDGHKVIIPQFPTPKNQTLDNWMKVFEKYKIEKDAIVIGHSLGVPFLLNVLEKQPVKAAFLVAGFTGKTGNQFDESMATFAQREFDWKKIQQNCPKFRIFHSDNDPYVPLSKAEELADNLDTGVILIKKAGHFNKAAGYSKFPRLLQEIKPFLRK